MLSYFIWNGVDSRSMFITTKGHAPFIRPQERITHIKIPGKTRELTIREGDNIFDSYIQTIAFTVNGAINVNKFFRWLSGDGYVTFSSDPDKIQPAAVIGAVTLEKVSRNLDLWRGQVQFYCEALKQRIHDTSKTLTAAGTVRNAGDVDAFPVIIATPALGADTMTVTVNGKTLTISNVSGAVRIDSEAQEVSNEARTELLTQETGGPFPVLAVGDNTVGGSGWASLEIYKNERFL